MTTHEPPPEAQLIHRLREEKVPKLSMREAAKQAGMSAPLWTQNEQGYRKVTRAVTIPIRATDEKLAHMAHVVGATPAQLREAGRDGAAAILEKLLAAEPDPTNVLMVAIRNSSGLTDRQKQKLIELAERSRE